MTTSYEHVECEHDSDAFFLGYALADYMAHTRLSEQSLLGWLGIDPACLPALAVCPSPDPGGSSFRDDCRRIGERFGCNADRLATMLGELAWDHGPAPTPREAAPT